MKSDLINLIFINSYLAPQAKKLRKRPSDTSHIDHHKLYLQDRKNDVGIHLSKYIPVHYDPYSSTFQYRILNFPVQNFSSTEKGAFPVHFPVHFPLKYIQVHSSTFQYFQYIVATLHQEIRTWSQNEGEEAVDVVAVEAEAVGVAVEAEEGDDQVHSE